MKGSPLDLLLQALEVVSVCNVLQTVGTCAATCWGRSSVGIAQQLNVW